MIKLKMPNGGDERIDEGSILVIREPVPFEKEETPEVQSCVWGGGLRLYPAESIADILGKINGMNFARVTAPGGSIVLVNADQVQDRDNRTPVDDERTNSVIIFGSGPLAPRVRVRETRAELVTVWTKLGLDPQVVDSE